MFLERIDSQLVSLICTVGPYHNDVSKLKYFESFVALIDPVCDFDSLTANCSNLSVFANTERFSLLRDNLSEVVIAKYFSELVLQLNRRLFIRENPVHLIKDLFPVFLSYVKHKSVFFYAQNLVHFLELLGQTIDDDILHGEIIS